jgi:hypothetical protein
MSLNTKTCSNCGTPNFPSNVRCKSCGHDVRTGEKYSQVTPSLSMGHGQPRPSVMTCPQCSRPLHSTDFCGSCGISLSSHKARVRQSTCPSCGILTIPGTQTCPRCSVQLPVLHRGFKCPYCSSTFDPIHKGKISSTGVIVFVVLLLFCFPIAWVGLLMKEDVVTCSSCLMKLS